jgi:hypothetical protein
MGHSMTRTIFIAAAFALAAILPAVPAQAAGVGRTFLSAAGSDSNNCANVLTPCRHLATAYAATAVNGEIYVLDPANYGSVTITGPVSIEGHGWASIAPVAGQAAITINANTGDKINITGVVLDGTAIANTTGIAFNLGGTLTVSDSVIRNFTDSGISFVPNSSALSQIFVSNTLLSDNGINGINIAPTGTGTTNGVIDHVRMQNNVDFGLNIFSSTEPVNVTVNDCVSANNGFTGVNANSSGTTQVNVMVRNSTIANNVLEGLQAVDGGAVVRVTRSTITGNGAGWNDIGGGTVVSYGDNNIDGNAGTNTEPPSPLTYK